MKRIAPLALGMFAIGLDAFILSGLLPGMADSFDVSLAAVAQVVTGFTFAFAISAPLLAVATAKVGRKKLALYALTIFAIANAASALAPSLWVMVLVRVLAGAVGGVYSPAAVGTAVQLVPPAQQGRALGTIMSGLSVSTILGVPVGVLVGTQVGWRAALWVVVGVIIVAIITIAALVPSVGAAPTPGLKDRFAVLTDGRVLGRMFVMFLYGVAQMGLVYTFLPSILKDSAGVSTKSLPVYLLIAGVTSFVGNALAGARLDKGTSPKFMLGAALAAVAVIIAVFPYGAFNAIAAGVVILFYGFAVAHVQLPLQYQLMRIVPQHTSIVVSLLNSALYLGTAVGAAIGGAVLAGASTTALTWTGAAVVTVALLISLAIKQGEAPQTAPGTAPAHDAQPQGAAS
ncbi:MFS transporter [Streptomyces mirabilis]|jgi:predicted MFS family arabinose efflux permease|uniref:Predicted arabinose efflux permease, MFS family n=1 Tax=Streptomyces mirabilis TaxID=68239 RepID=A0A1I2NLM4_9ACTN|nr:MFS transporter [Streptomyces mirabilis]SFG03930.1 Predicted arabinose efflux permease, MFS family [Streptomyces mirabilis]